ncbi:aspartyl-tRNA synthetase 2, mitochondrial [Physocladia obscura]|uniref:Aspartyl-tRNA synthetase 2, mitochondrial n=1 Tax=Physocladia obscura TaxID=109957 RepID=A0AAD5XBW2_9FUNG|nr:aspartyl-tRNA synthetase 2, mitochondrial [Physocladia obscura]
MKIAIAQISSVLLDKQETLKKVYARVNEAADAGAAIVVFGEATVPGYPCKYSRARRAGWLDRTDCGVFDSARQKELQARYLSEGVEVERDLGELRALAAARGISVVLGVMERAVDRGGHSLYCSAVTIAGATGRVESVHRKLVPTHEERLAWAPGDGHGLRVSTVVAQPFAVGVLNCWENHMPLTRAALYAQGENLHLALWPGCARNTKDLSRFIAFESRSYVVSCSNIMSRDLLVASNKLSPFPHFDIMLAEMDRRGENWIADGGSCVVSPDGSFLLEPVVCCEGVFLVDVDLNKVYQERSLLDPSGHYSRPDVLRLVVDRHAVWPRISLRRAGQRAIQTQTQTTRAASVNRTDRGGDWERLAVARVADADIEGRRVTLCGWMQRARRAGPRLAFASLRDASGTTQLVAGAAESGKGGADVPASTGGPSLVDALLAVSPESVVRVSGVVRRRPSHAIQQQQQQQQQQKQQKQQQQQQQTTTSSSHHQTSINQFKPVDSSASHELLVHEFFVLNSAAPLPFDTTPKALLKDSPLRPNDETMLKFRYIDLRQPWLAENLQKRSAAAFAIRSLLVKNLNFTEVETPYLFKSTPEGAREFLVPTRTRGEFFALPQSPQQFKQSLMSGGVERYFQFARCFRDEALGADRQQEFTQVDLEMSFVSQSDIMDVVEAMIKRVWKDILDTQLVTPFQVMTYHEAMSRFGSDKPDTRYGLEITDVSTFFDLTGSDVGVVEAIVIPASIVKNLSKSDKKLDAILKIVQEETFPYYGGNVTVGRDLFVYKVTETTEKHAELLGAKSDALHKTLQAQKGDTVILHKRKQVGYFGGHTVLGRVRLLTAKHLIESGQMPAHVVNQWNFLWIVDFPLFTPVAGSDGQLESTHHPFTAPVVADTHLLYTHPEQCRAQHYDIVLNGQEIGGGSIRVHDAVTQKYIFGKILGHNEEKIQRDFGHVLDMLKYGCPPHGGIALGFDRFVAILCGAASIRDVIAFPKLAGGDLFSGSPSVVDDEGLKPYHVKVI